MPTPRQLSPTTDFWAWRADAACQGQDELFYHGEDERKGLRRQKERDAKQICEHCPVLEQCRTYALEAREMYGVWGGLTEMERHHIFRADSTRQESA